MNILLDILKTFNEWLVFIIYLLSMWYFSFVIYDLCLLSHLKSRETWMGLSLMQTCEDSNLSTFSVFIGQIIDPQKFSTHYIKWCLIYIYQKIFWSVRSVF